MKKIKRFTAAILLIAVCLSVFASCEILPIFPPIVGNDPEYTISIKGDDRVYMKVGERLELEVNTNCDDPDLIEWTSSDNNYVAVRPGGSVSAISAGEATLRASVGDAFDEVVIEVRDAEVPPVDNPGGGANNPGGGTVDPPVLTDIYAGMSESEFYASYKVATSYLDAQFRTSHGFMSGSIYDQDQEPTISSYQPKSNGKFIRNSVGIYGDNGNSYTIVDAYGKPFMTIYRSGAYVVLEEVAAYLFAFGTIPPNYTASKKTDPEESVWGKYLRVNHTKFSGNTKKYPYEPVLPNISGCGGDLQYYEVDIGTTGTDCDPSYDSRPYNNGKNITRGAARIVYTHSDINGNKIIDINEKYLFYTYNHYNDFQEYLNYYGGWGEMFGNITGGGKISSKYDYNPTPYVPVVLADISSLAAAMNYNPWYVLVDDRKYA